ncbi:STAS domain-containing protein [Streptomyces sp. NPDC056738]|uniref:STAS domain-containing protein n=1 Tax=Streptomyces sp. NPDC056738 TaxID=3345933 RepID=UPI0036BAF727
MTTSHPPAFTLTVEVQPAALVIRVAGDLDHETCDELMRTVDQYLLAPQDPGRRFRELRVDFAALGSIDSMGLSTLLMIRRRTDAAGLSLYLDQRPRGMDRLLEITGTLEHLTALREESDGERSPGAG